jgi:hypothetical protein
MTRTKPKPVVDYKLTTSFDEVRRKLSDPILADRLEKPLAYWVVSTDRRLPFPFLDRPLGELVNTSLADLLGTAGIGIRKVQTLIMLLNRAAKPLPPGGLAPPANVVAAENLTSGVVGRGGAGDVDAAIVSEALWVQWRATVCEHHLENETLGRLASTLRDLPRVIWRRPLSNYTQLTLAEIRHLRTHGEKRVAALLDVFGSLHTILAHAGKRPHLAVQIAPRSLVELEEWAMRWLQTSGTPSLTEIQNQFVTPLLNQVRVDANNQVAKLAERRISSRSTTVRQMAERLGLTRARIYQLLDEVADIVAVRWPNGRFLVGTLRERLHAWGTERRAVLLFDAACELFFAAREGDSSTAADSAGQAYADRVSGDRSSGDKGSGDKGSDDRGSDESGANGSRRQAARFQGAHGNGHSAPNGASRRGLG